MKRDEHGFWKNVLFGDDGWDRFSGGGRRAGDDGGVYGWAPSYAGWIVGEQPAGATA
jgi:hypothetical protein